jgi:hypothetical protein
MIGFCIAHGLRTGRRNFSLVAILWFWTLLLASLAALPAWAWFSRGFNLAPESDRLLSDFNFLAVAELGQYDRSSVFSLLNVSMFGVALFALLANPLVSGGLIENLMARDGESTLRRFLRGGGRYFWRYLRLLAYGIVTGGLALSILAASLSPLSDRLSESSWEPGGLVGAMLVAAILFLAGGLVLTALDFARVRIAGSDTRRVLRTWLSSLGFVLRRIVPALSLFLVPTLIFVAVLGLYGVYLRYVPAHTSLLILLMFLVQQAVMFCRASLRVSLVSSVLEYHQQAAPPAFVPAPVAEEPRETVASPRAPEWAEPAPAALSEPQPEPAAAAAPISEKADDTTRE